ncbi:unnamed protein product [Mytilus edulis]|uniref:CCHC-type domain-containing protein n=1 Tax=Mytilus edulis TaxID=6550 RepID=A0A8S3S3E3_MYTED|nr:unnamed protein product [Mytilus edulis]
MSNMDPLEQKNDQMSKDGLELDKETRLRTLTEKAQIEYDQTVTNYFSKLSTLKRNVDYEIGTYKSEDQTKESISVCQKRIENSLDKYLNMAEEISQYLKRKNTADSLRELENHESVYTNVELSADEVFRDMQRIQQRTKTKSVKSVRSNGRSSVASSTTKMKARAEAAKASLEFAAKEAELKKADAEIQRKQMDIQADLEFLSKQKEAAVAYAEYKAAMEDDDSQHDAKSLQGIPKQDELDRTRQYVESHRNVTFNSQNFRDNPVHSNTHLGDHTSAPFIPSTHQDQMPVSEPVETHDTNNPKNPVYEKLLSYFDSSVGINPIMSKLPQSLQYKWRDKATNYKKSKNVPYPPFSFFVEFISDQASKYNDPGFKFESDQNNNSPQARDKESGRSSQRPRLSARNINVSKTEIATSTEGIKPIKLKCAIHKTNHSLNDCRSFLSKSIEDRRKIIKENGICFKCINSKDHLSRNCPENVQYQATRSVSSEDIGSSCWLQGPTKFLSGELQASASTETLTTLVNPDLDKEVRPIVTVTKTTIEDSHSIGSERFQNFSSWKSLVNGIAVLQRFIQSRFKKVTLQDIDVVKSLNESEIFIIKTIQTIKSKMYNLRDRSRIPQGSNSLSRGITTLASPIIPTWSVASTNIDTCSFGDNISHNYLASNQAISLNQGEINTSPRPFSSTASNIQREVSTNPFLFPTQSKSDSAIATITREKSCESDEIIKMRQELEALRNENLQKSYESEEMVKMRQELEALRNFKNLQMKNNAQHFTESKSDPVIRSPNSYAETQQRSANSCNNTTLPETQQRSTNSCNNITLPETQQRPTYSYNTTTLPDTQQQQSYAYANMTIPEIQHRPNYSGTSTIMPEIQQRTDYEQYPNNSSVSNWLPRQQYGRPQQQYGRPQQQYHNIENSKIDNGRRNRVPFYNGRDPWSAYFMQFELIAEINRWDTDTKAIELVTALKDEAMVYASYLSPETKRSFFGLCAAMSNRFGDHGYPETYRQELHTLRKQGKENIHEYASRVEMLVRRSFPTIDVATHSTLSVEYMLRGLPDQSIAIELLTKRITSMTEAIHQVTLYETYKRGNKDRNIRQLSMQETVDLDEGEDDIEIRKVGGKRYVTEERLTQFERGMKNSITQSIAQSLEKVIQTEMAKYNTPQDYDSSAWHNKQVYRDYTTKMKNHRCFNCNEDGHYIRDCPKEKRSPYHKENRIGFIRNDERSQNQTEESLNC